MKQQHKQQRQRSNKRNRRKAKRKPADIVDVEPNNNNNNHNNSSFKTKHQRVLLGILVLGMIAFTPYFIFFESINNNNINNNNNNNNINNNNNGLVTKNDNNSGEQPPRSSTKRGATNQTTTITTIATSAKPTPVRPPTTTTTTGGTSANKDGWVMELRTPYLDLAATSELSFGNADTIMNTYFQQIGHSLARAYYYYNNNDTTNHQHYPHDKICSFQPLLLQQQQRQHNNKKKRNWKTKTKFFFQNKAPEGLFLNKVPKTASTVMTTVNIRISRRLGMRLSSRVKANSNNINNNNNNNNNNNTTPNNNNNNNNNFDYYCAHYDEHCGGYANAYFGNRNKSHSFLWGSIRDPASRALSRIFFEYSKKNGQRSNDIQKEEEIEEIEIDILQQLKENRKRHAGIVTAGKGGFQLQYLSIEEEELKDWSTWSKSYPTVVQRPDLLHDRVQNVIQEYDFLALTERVDESLVALQLILGLPVGDILAVYTKVSGASYYFQPNRRGSKKGKCVVIQKSYRTSAIQDYLTSPEWYAVNYADYVLYAAANKSLDLTIEQLGQDRFETALQQYRYAQKVVSERCRDQIFPPCSAATGEPQIGLAEQNCYNKDQGCGYKCIDDIVLEQGWE